MTRRIAMGLVALALASPLPALAQAGDVRGQIEKISQAWEKAYNSGNAAAVTALYAKDAQVMAPGAETASGTQAIQAMFTQAMKGGSQNKLTTSDVVAFGDYALETGKWVATATDGKHLDHGAYMTLYKKEGGGWKLYRDTWNSAMAPK
jgi:uncharacterized protein (TIGR02246 family)